MKYVVMIVISSLSVSTAAYCPNNQTNWFSHIHGNGIIQEVGQNLQGQTVIPIRLDTGWLWYADDEPINAKKVHLYLFLIFSRQGNF